MPLCLVLSPLYVVRRDYSNSEYTFHGFNLALPFLSFLHTALRLMFVVGPKIRGGHASHRSGQCEKVEDLSR